MGIQVTCISVCLHWDCIKHSNTQAMLLRHLQSTLTPQLQQHSRPRWLILHFVISRNISFKQCQVKHEKGRIKILHYSKEKNLSFS